jgi:hypothetical protein
VYSEHCRAHAGTSQVTKHKLHDQALVRALLFIMLRSLVGICIPRHNRSTLISDACCTALMRSVNHAPMNPRAHVLGHHYCKGPFWSEGELPLVWCQDLPKW